MGEETNTYLPCLKHLLLDTVEKDTDLGDPLSDSAQPLLVLHWDIFCEEKTTKRYTRDYSATSSP